MELLREGVREREKEIDKQRRQQLAFEYVKMLYYIAAIHNALYSIIFDARRDLFKEIDFKDFTNEFKVNLKGASKAAERMEPMMRCVLNILCSKDKTIAADLGKELERLNAEANRVDDINNKNNNATEKISN